MKLYKVEAGKCVYHIVTTNPITKEDIIEVIKGAIKEMPEVARVLGHRDALDHVEVYGTYTVTQLKVYQLKDFQTKEKEQVNVS